MKENILLSIVMSFFMIFCNLAQAGTGWCTTTGGTKQFTFPFVESITDPSDNYAGLTKNRIYKWSSGSGYNGTCDCTGNAISFIKATVPLTFSNSTGGLNYYALNANLAVASELYISGNVGQYKPTPISNQTNNYSDGCGTTNYTSGAAGYLSLYFIKPFVGVSAIPLTKVLDIFVSKTSGSFSSVPMSSVYISGTVTVPQSCNINAGQVINVNLGDVMAENIKTNGAIANGYTPKIVNITLACTNIAAGVNVRLSLSGQPSAGNSSALATTNSDIGVKMTDQMSNVIPPNSGRLPVTMDYTSQTGVGILGLAPMNVTGNTPSAGSFTAVATVNAELQ